MKLFLKNIFWTKPKALFKLGYHKKDGLMSILNSPIFWMLLFILASIMFLPTIWLLLHVDTSFIGHSEKKLVTETANPNSGAPPVSIDPRVKSLLASSKTNKAQGSGKSGAILRLNYKATQVIARDNAGDPSKTVPIGTSLIGKTLTSIDTREPNQTIKVLLPYGGKSKVGAEIEKNTILFGRVTYSGHGEKVYLSLTKALSPEGHEFEIEAQALNPKDYSPGLAGTVNSNSDLRVLSAVGLAVVSGATEIMTEREMVNGMAAPKLELQNAAYQGVSKSSQAEASREASKLNESEDYITIPAGSDVIIALTKSYTEK